MRARALTRRIGGRAEPSLRPDAERFESLFSASSTKFDQLVGPWRDEFTWPVGRTNNGAFESVDIELYHSILRTHRPQLVIEVGGGNSTLFCLEALERNGGGRVVVIDPRPRARLPRNVEHIASLGEDVDLAVFDQLAAGDVLFIDSSHTTEEARYHVDVILPRLAPGVLIHHHDILFPYDAYYLGDKGLYGEQDVVLDFYQANMVGYEILVGAAWVRRSAPELITTLIDSYRWQPHRIPGSLWAVKRAT